MSSQGFASLGQSIEDVDPVELLLQQVHECRQESAEQLGRLRALLMQCETPVAAAAAFPVASLSPASLSFEAPSLLDSQYARNLQAREFQEELNRIRARGTYLAGLNPASLGLAAPSLNDSQYARNLQAHELQEELNRNRARRPDLSGAFRIRGTDPLEAGGFVRLADTQRIRDDDLLLRRNDDAAFRQYLSLLDYPQSSMFHLSLMHGSRSDPSEADQSYLSLGLGRRDNPALQASIDHMLREPTNAESLLRISLLSPAERNRGALNRDSVQGDSQDGSDGKSSFRTASRSSVEDEKVNQEPVDSKENPDKQTESKQNEQSKDF